MRESGILMHISSLPGPYGVGSMGASAYKFVDFLVEAGQRYWQILPLNPTGYGDSPYQSFSTFAGNHYLIDLDTLAREGLLLPDELLAVNWGDGERVDFGLLYNQRIRLLKIAHSRFAETQEYLDFVRDNSLWLEDYALFMAIKEHFHGRDWQSWSVSLLMRLPPVMDAYREELRDAIKGAISSKDGSSLVGNMASQGTTPRRLTDLIGSLCDLTSGSGDKGTPIVYIQGYFDNFTTD